MMKKVCISNPDFTDLSAIILICQKCIERLGSIPTKLEVGREGPYSCV